MDLVATWYTSSWLLQHCTVVLYIGMYFIFYPISISHHTIARIHSYTLLLLVVVLATYQAPLLSMTSNVCPFRSMASTRLLFTCTSQAKIVMVSQLLQMLYIKTSGKVSRQVLYSHCIALLYYPSLTLHCFIIQSFCEKTLSTPPSYHHGVRVEVRVQLASLNQHHNAIHDRIRYCFAFYAPFPSLYSSSIIHSTWLHDQSSICWIKSSTVYTVWHGLYAGLKWAVDNMDPASSHDRLSFLRRASVASLLASHVSGWFSRPDDNHKGWRDSYRTLSTHRLSHHAFMLHRKVFALTAFGNLSTKVLLENAALSALLPMSFVAINRYSSSSSSQASPVTATRRQHLQDIDATVPVAAPRAQVSNLSSK